MYQPRSQGLSSSRPFRRERRGGKMRDPGNEVEYVLLVYTIAQSKLGFVNYYCVLLSLRFFVLNMDGLFPSSMVPVVEQL